LSEGCDDVAAIEGDGFAREGEEEALEAAFAGGEVPVDGDAGFSRLGFGAAEDDEADGGGRSIADSDAAFDGGEGF
jgi:hypothetical protein